MNGEMAFGRGGCAAYRLALQRGATREGGPIWGCLRRTGVFWMGIMLAWGELKGGFGVLLPMGLAWVGLVVVPLAMVSRRKMWGLKGWGVNRRVDQMRGVLAPLVVGVGVGTWFGWQSVFLAVPLCLLLYLVLPWFPRLKARQLRFTTHAHQADEVFIYIDIMPLPLCWTSRQGRDNNMPNIGLSDISNVRIGKHITMEVQEAIEDAERQVNEACTKCW